MQWTRMKDDKGGYYAVNTCYGVRIGVRVYRAPAGSRYPWLVELDGKEVDRSHTCADAKDRALAAVFARRHEITKTAPAFKMC